MQFIIRDGDAEARAEHLQLFLVQLFLLMRDVLAIARFAKAITLDRLCQDDRWRPGVIDSSTVSRMHLDGIMAAQPHARQLIVRQMLHHLQQARIAPSEPEWVAVARVSDLRLGRIQRFSANGIEGFVLNSGGRITALSAVCTDQGCILWADAAKKRLNCPCHYADFDLDGTPRAGRDTWGTTPLPAIEVRMNGENVEALLPKIV